MNILTKLLIPILAVFFSCLVTGWFYGFGPVIWVKRSAGRRRARDTGSRQELVLRVQQLLPHAMDGNVVFSVEEEQSTSGGSKVQVTTSTYHYKVFVAEPQSLWIIPFYYQKGPRTYQLGNPVCLTRELVQNVTLSGTKGKKREVTFWLKPEVELNQVVMVLEPFQFRKNRHYPFDFFQEQACTQAYATTQRLALLACGKDTMDLEESRLRNACDNHAVTAFMCGFFGMAVAISGSLLPALVLFGAAAVLLVLILAKGRIPKLSLALVILEALCAYLFSGSP